MPSPLPLQHAAKVKTVTIIAVQRTQLKELTDLMANLLWCHLYENFHKYNFRNDHAIMKITKV